MKNSITSLVSKVVPLAILAAVAAPASAQKAGDNIFSAGLFYIHTMDSSKPMKTNGVEQPGTGSTVGDATTLGLAYTRFLTDNWSVTIDGGIPPKFKLDATGTLAQAGISEIGNALQWSPAIVAKYNFGNASDKLRPFVGAGMTYVWYSNIKTTDKFQEVMSQKVSRNPAMTTLKSDISLSSSFAPVLTAGLNYNLEKNWSVGASVSFIPLKTDAEVMTETPMGKVKTETTLTLNPLVFFLNVGYKF